MTEPAHGSEGTGRIVIADAGPLIHLDELQCLGLLADFSEVRVPDAVWREVEHHRPATLGHSGIRLIRNFPEASEQVDALNMLYTLHAGEREALSLCLEFSGALFLTDGTAARLAAKTLGVEARGTIGILVRAIHRRQLPKATVVKLLIDLPEHSSLHIRQGLLAEIVRQVADAPDFQ